MPVVTLRQESLEQGHFYVPQFEITIAGAPLPHTVLSDVIQVTYKDNIKEIDSFELTVNNWDAVTREFKYVGAETTDSLKNNPLHRLFDPSNKEVEAWLGYAGHLRLMMTGTFTTAEPTFPSSGAPTLTIRGLNVLHQLRRKQYTTTWGDEKISVIAKNIETLMDPGPPPKKRFPLPIVIDKSAKEDKIPYVAQKNEYDIDFLLSQARKYGYVVFVLKGDPHGKGDERKRRLYFGLSQADMPGMRDVTFALKWGISLVDFKPTLTTANQIRSVTVNGWNRATKESINVTVTLDDPKLNINRDLRWSARPARRTTCEHRRSRRAFQRHLLRHWDHAHHRRRWVHDQIRCPARGQGQGGQRMKKINGVVIGIVKSLDDPERHGKIELQFPWLSEAQRSAWAPVAAPMAGKKRGVFYMPELGDEALVAFEHGDFDHPFIIGYLWNGIDTPPETNNRNRVIKTPGGHELRFEDSDGAKKIIITSSSGHQIALDDTPAGQTITVMTKGKLSLVMDDKNESIQLQGGGRILALRDKQIQIS